MMDPAGTKINTLPDGSRTYAVVIAIENLKLVTFICSNLNIADTLTNHLNSLYDVGCIIEIIAGE